MTDNAHDEAPHDAAPTGTSVSAHGKRPAEEWRALKKTEAHWFAGAQASWQWIVGFELTEAEYDAAVDGAKNVLIGDWPHPARKGEVR